MYKDDLVLNYLQWLICNKIKSNQIYLKNTQKIVTWSFHFYLLVTWNKLNDYY